MSSSSAHQPDRSRWVALTVLCAGMLMIVLDQNIVAVALPSIQRDLGFQQSSLAWVVNAYVIPFGGLLLLAGRLGDLVGPRRLFLSGLVVFTLASLLCGLATGQSTLVAARFVQGVGGALTSAVILGLIVTMFPRPAERARAIGVYSFVAAAGASIGLLLGGVLTEAVNWHWIFFVNVPIGAVAVLAGRRLLPAQPGLGLRQGADYPGAGLVTAGLMLGVYTIVQSNTPLWRVALGVLSLLLLAAFVLRQATARDPLLRLGIFAARNRTGANAVQMLVVAGMMGMFFLGTLYLQRVLGYGPLGIGLAFLPTAAAIGTLSVGFSARLTNRFGARAVLLGGLTLIALGLAWLSRSPVAGHYPTDVLPAVLVMGVGAGLTIPAVTTLAMADAAPSDSGLASGLVNTTQQVGAAIGLAGLATVATNRTAHLLHSGQSPAVALTAGYHLGFQVAVGLVLAGLLLAAAVLRPISASPAGPAAVSPAASPAGPAAVSPARPAVAPAAGPVGPAEVGPAEVGPAEVGPAEVGPAEAVPAANQ